MKNIFFLLFLGSISCLAQTNADKILAKAINYHDPSSNWSSLSSTFIFKETRPEGADRSTVIALNNEIGYMKINRNDEEIYEVNGEEASVLKGDKDEARALMLRNYYLYLWGLPMKLYDESTPEITLVSDEKVDGTTCKVLRIAYEKDIWYFYIDEYSGRMLQYKFYKDEEKGQGELITLGGEMTVSGIRIPQKRSWFTLPEMKYLGTDMLTRAE